ncbi:MAG: hypothetical protein GYA18_08270 [Chloroflexi bacterium]|nr:hypothetical protein [Chloroflexota bacterium]
MIYINGHEIVLDDHERLEAWTGYGRIVKLAMDFIRTCPTDVHNDLPWYLLYSCFWTDPIRPTDWPDNPAGKFAWAITTLLKYYPYSGKQDLLGIGAAMLEHLWKNRTPDNYNWSGVPYASAHPGSGIYFGARADGEYVSEPDKIAQAGKAYIDFYKITEEKRYLEWGEHCAAVLAEKLQQGDTKHSPLPFRVDVRNGQVIEAYTAHMIAVVWLFDDLIELGMKRYRHARELVWKWIKAFPLQNNIWKGYFEDIRLDVENQNRDQLSPMETARYLLEHRDQFPEWQTTVVNLIEWVRSTLGAQPFFSAIPIHEQKFCYFVMGSHTARFASICALFAELTGDTAYQETAIRSFNWATYMANTDGTVTVGIDRPDYYNQCWFTDGYFDYVPHFIDGMASYPQLAPDDEDHILRSTSVIQHISYEPNHIQYRCFNSVGYQRLRLTFLPKNIKVDNKTLPRKANNDRNPGWSVGKVPFTLDIIPGGREVLIEG